jgi:RNA polymerase sigma-70 factor (ECF subfamily)
MGFLPEVELGETFWPFTFFRENFGFVPNLFRAQTLLPRVIEAEAKIADAILLKERALSRRIKECILLAVSAAHRNNYCVTAHCEMLRALGVADRKLRLMTIDHRRAGLSGPDVALLDFGLKLSHQPTRVSRQDIDALRQHGFSDEAILEAILTAAFTDFVCTLSEGLDAVPDFRPRKLASKRIPLRSNVRARAAHGHGAPKPYLRAVELSPETFAPFALFREAFGFVPNIFRAQTLRPDILEAEAEVVRTVLLTTDVLPRVQKEYILLVVSAANLNTYCVAVHCEMLRGLGIPEDESDQIAVDHRQAGLSAANTALLDFALKLSQRAIEVDRGDIEGLRRHGFTDEQILESIVMTGLTRYLNTLQMGLGTVPDFEPRRVFGLGAEAALRDLEPAGGAGDKMVSPLRLPARLRGVARAPMPQVAVADPDAALVARVRGGDLAAFEELVRRHQRRIYRTLIGITGNAEDAEDGTQNAFLKAFERIDKFRGAAKFSTWLIRIAINEGIQRLRSRKRVTALDDNGSEDAEEFRPRQVRAWDDNPEQLYSKAEMRKLVERALMKLPAWYRMVVMLRDIEQLSTEEAAKALGLGVAALKSRLLRGRLMLREALAPHFIGRGKGRARV